MRLKVWNKRLFWNELLIQLFWIQVGFWSNTPPIRFIVSFFITCDTVLWKFDSVRLQSIMVIVRIHKRLEHGFWCHNNGWKWCSFPQFHRGIYPSDDEGRSFLLKLGDELLIDYKKRKGSLNKITDYHWVKWWKAECSTNLTPEPNRTYNTLNTLSKRGITQVKWYLPLASVCVNTWSILN